ncbi:hypothetical protein V5799_005637 [Amblyomma americanum]|uniref:TIL domain-containing protein n=1 Tax=Amblyomma americanum TaxID=6943 RepID=A0AAQ4DYP5_AMBAM
MSVDRLFHVVEFGLEGVSSCVLCICSVTARHHDLFPGARRPRAAAVDVDPRLAALRLAIETSLGSSSADGKRPRVAVLRAGDANGLKITRKVGVRGPKPTCRGGNEAYADCGVGCELVCGRPMPEGGCRGSCKAGCICKHGYIRSSADGPCVPVSQCQPDCGPNRRFEVCASLCPAVCDLRPRRCLRLCRMNACVCADGYLLARNGTACVPRDSCRRF